MNEIYKEMNQPNQNQFNLGDFMGQVNQLKAKGGNPEQMIQALMNSGRIPQDVYNMAVQRRDQILKMIGK